jgi:hypothetical protein
MQWVNATYPGSGTIASFGGVAEEHLRPPASIAFSFAVLVTTGGITPGVSAYSAVEIQATAVRLIDSFAQTHVANGGNWGGDPATAMLELEASFPYRWQGALWVAFAACGARLLWSQLSTAQQQRVENMMVSESNRFLAYPPPYYRDPSGRVLFFPFADSKAEENSWNGWVLTLTAGAFPEHANAELWLRKGLEFCISATATPATPTSKRPHNGLSGWALKAGSNIELGGYLYNHNIIAANYVASLAQNWINGLSFALSTGKIPAASLVNASLVYRSMTDVFFSSPPQLAPGGTVYKAGSADIYYPGGDDGDANRMACYVALDGLAHCIQGDSKSSVPADTWLTRHAQRQLDLHSASPTARRSPWDMYHATWPLLADYVVGALSSTISNELPSALLKVAS